MFEKIIEKINNDLYKNIQEGIKEIKKTYDRGLLTITEREDLIAILQWHFTTTHNQKNNYIVIY